jgi:hypothetical protein
LLEQSAKRAVPAAAAKLIFAKPGIGLCGGAGRLG